jgi:hypothetical protein
VDLSARELATVLAALRYWQDERMPHHGEAAYPELFEDAEPLDACEIDDLCVRLNDSR